MNEKRLPARVMSSNRSVLLVCKISVRLCTADTKPGKDSRIGYGATESCSALYSIRSSLGRRLSSQLGR